ncbi:MAG: linear amide C-N hydrolase [Ruminococcaceae bacterium]|nr:linear amide C-N hydrolase [Oscillospiraceae bacterium]
MKKSLIIALLLPLLILCTAVSCTQDTPTPDTAEPEIIEEAPETTEAPEVPETPEITEITETPEIPEEDPMEDIPDYDPIFVSEEEGLVSVFPGVSTAVYRGNYGFDEFLDQGGASTEAEILQFLMSMLNDPEGLRFSIDGLGCSTMQAPSKDGYYFGRNFDWDMCKVLFLTSYPEDGYASVSTVNTDFITKLGEASLTDEQLILAAHYAPLDGMNEKGLCISINLLPDGMTLKQETGKTNLTITSAIRLMLNKAATVEEAVELLEQYDLSTGMNMVIHYMISDAQGNSVCVEFIDNVLHVTDAKVMTNHYLTPGEYFEQSRSQSSFDRYNKLAAALEKTPVMSFTDVRDAMKSAISGTVWTVIYDQHSLTAYYHHNNRYGTPIVVKLMEE